MLSAQTQQLKNLRVWHSPKETRIVFDVSASTEYETFVLQNPLRLVVDLQQVDLSVRLPEVQTGNQHLNAIRAGRPTSGVLRVVFDLKAAVDVDSFVLTPNELYGHRLVIDLRSQSVIATEPPPLSNASVAEPSLENSNINVDQTMSNDAGLPSEPDTNSLEIGVTESSVTESSIALPIKPRKFVVAIDAGHGGDDPGALGHNGTKEKKLTLAIAKELYQRVNKHPDMKAVMIRTGDYFIQLSGRREKARKQDADVFISLHADAFTKKSARGMSVFALSQRGATSAMARTLAAKENASDLIGGVSLADKDEVLAKVLVDLSMTNTISESVNLGGRVLHELGKLGRLHSKRVEQANFSVLRSPDMPSILIETGFITNPEEERRLRSSKHQSKVADAIFRALDEYLGQTPYASRARYDSPDVGRGEGGASRSTTHNAVKYSRHTVVRGDTLSEIAQKYGISVRELKRLNKMRHNTAMLGSKLKVPTRSSASSTEVRQATVRPAVHTVKRGDSLSKVSAQYNVTIKALKRANGLRGNTLKKGQTLTIPGGTAQLSRSANHGPVKHKVKRGDTLSEIAQQYGSSVAKIKALNNLRGNTVMLGQTLTIPK